jgi:hypothetical protein
MDKIASPLAASWQAEPEELVACGRVNLCPGAELFPEIGCIGGAATDDRGTIDGWR